MRTSCGRRIARLAAAAAALGLLSGAGAEVAAQTAPAAAQEIADLRERLEERFSIVPLPNGVGLVPKSRSGDIRLIEVSDGAVVINGEPATGGELRTRLGDDADLVIRLTYLDSDARTALGAPDTPAPDLPKTEREAERDTDPPLEGRRVRRSSRSRDKVHIFRGVTVAENEIVEGDVVAVIGSARIDGEITGDVVVVLGRAQLGPKAVIGGDLTVVGGPVERSPTARIRGSLNEIDFMGGNFGFDDVHIAPFVVNPFGPVFRMAGLFSTGLRIALMALLACLVLLVARSPVERIAHRVSVDPLKAALVGLLVEFLFIPVLVVTIVVLAISIIGIPLLVLVPFAIVGFLLVLLFGFTGVAYRVGLAARGRLATDEGQPYMTLIIGVICVIAVTLLGRLVGVGGGPLSVFGFIILSVGLLFEYLAWTMGLGAAVLTRFAAAPAPGPGALAPADGPPPVPPPPPPQPPAVV